MIRTQRRPQGLFSLVCVAVTALSGCAQYNDGKPGDPGALALPSGQSCQSVRAELNRLDSRGVPARVEAAQSGRTLPPAQQAEVDRYNQLLNQYLGARCHV